MGLKIKWSFKIVCDICGRIRISNKIKHLTEQNEDGKFITIRYCSDNEDCYRRAHFESGYTAF